MSELSAYVPTPEKEARDFAKELREKMCPKCAVQAVNILINQGLFMPLSQFQLNYYKKVLQELNK